MIDQCRAVRTQYLIENQMFFSANLPYPNLSQWISGVIDQDFDLSVDDGAAQPHFLQNARGTYIFDRMF